MINISDVELKQFYTEVARNAANPNDAEFYARHAWTEMFGEKNPNMFLAFLSNAFDIFMSEQLEKEPETEKEIFHDEVDAALGRAQLVASEWPDYDHTFYLITVKALSPEALFQ